MSTRKLQLNVSGFTDGLNTEASVLNVLPSEMMDGSINAELLLNGAARRRKGVDFIGQSDTGGYLQTLRTGSASTETRQDSPSIIYAKLTAPNGSLVERIILFANNKFYIYEVTNLALRNVDHPYQTITLGTFCADEQKYYNVQFAQSGNRVYFAGKYIQPGYIKVNEDNLTVGVTHFSVLIRDLSLSRVSTRVKKTIDTVVRWFECIEAHTSDANNSPGDGVDGTWQTYWIELDGAPPASLGVTWGSGTDYTSNFIKRYNKTDTVTFSTPRPATIEFYAGRVWLAGDITRPNTIYFSQAIIKDADVEYFFQYADPNDTNDPDVVDDDGGVIELQGADIIFRLAALSSALCVLSQTGVWQINGSSSTFKATQFSILQALTDGVLGPECVCKVQQNIIVFAKTSVWFSQVERSITVSTTGQITFKSLSDKRVQAKYASIPVLSKAAGRALFNPSDNKVYYFYNSEVTDWDYSYNGHQQPGYSKNALILDTYFDEEDLQQNQVKRKVSGAFYIWEYADGAKDEQPYIACPFVAPAITANVAQTVTSSLGGVLAQGEAVVAAGGNFTTFAIALLAMQRSTSGDTVTIKNAFAVLKSSNIRDWASDVSHVQSFTSRIITGLQTGGDILHKKAGVYLYFVFKKVESGILDGTGVDVTPGGCYLRTAYNFATSTASNKYHDQVQIYKPYRYSYAYDDGRFDGHDHAWYKHRVRGRGNAFQIILENDGDKDFYFVGWSHQFIGRND